MSDVALRLLKLQSEFQNRSLAASTAAEFGTPAWGPRSEEEIAAEYAEALTAFFSGDQS